MILQPAFWFGLIALTFFEIVLGIDNVIFISILVNKLEESVRKKARFIGLLLALVTRISLLFCLTWLVKFSQPLIQTEIITLSARDIVLGLGGLFLIIKSSNEIFINLEKTDNSDMNNSKKILSLKAAILQIVLLDIIFSFDSLLTAIGLTSQIVLMIIAIVIAMVIMLFFSSIIAKYIEEHPSLEIIGLAFLIMIGFTLFLEAMHNPIPKGYLYCAISFSLLIEFVNIRRRTKKKQKKLSGAIL